jgi:hypothetical protein
LAIELLLERRPFGFVPISPADIAEVSTFPVGAVVKAKITRSKSKPMFRFFWKLIQMVADGTGIGKVPLSKELLIRCGYVHSFVMRNGDTAVEPMSIGEMDYDTFKEFFDEALALVCQEYVAIPRNKLLREAGQMAGMTYEQAFSEGVQKSKNIQKGKRNGSASREFSR